MSMTQWLFSKFSSLKYNPDEDPLVQQRDDIEKRTEHVVRMTDEIQRRLDNGRFPILLDERVIRRD
jgi:hypothetical protein